VVFVRTRESKGEGDDMAPTASLRRGRGGNGEGSRGLAHARG
jgi:hypothetical protein